MSQLKEMDAARKAKGKDPTKNPAQIPKTDTDARVLPNKEGGYAPNYTPMAVTETENGFIVGADVVVGNVEHTMLLPMVDQIIADFGADVVTVMGDGAYSADENLRGCEERELELLSPIATVAADSPADRSDPNEPVSAEKIAQLPIMPQTKCFDKSAFAALQTSHPRWNKTALHGNLKKRQRQLTTHFCQHATQSTDRLRESELKLRDLQAGG